MSTTTPSQSPASDVATPTASAAAPINPRAYLEQIQQVSDSLRELEALRELERNARYLLVVVPRAGRAECLEFDAEEDWVHAIRQRVGQDVQVFPMTGYRWRVTRGPHRHLVGPVDQKIPLFSVTESDVDPDGWLSDPTDTDTPDAPPADAPPATA